MKCFSIRTAVGVVLLSLVLSACNDLGLSPTNEFTEENYWTSASKAEMVLNTAYSQMSDATYYFYNEALSDNAYVGRGDPANVSTIARGNHNPSTDRFDNQWDMHYAGIKTVHVFLENIERVEDMPENLRTRMTAEARFIRAWHYFKLTTWFGDVPLFTEDVSVDESQSIGATPHSEIVDFIHAELEAIADDLPATYEASERGRITSGAAVALNARVYLYDGDWQGVIDNTEPLINSSQYGAYSLFPDYRALFLPENEYNDEIIFSFQYAPTTVTHNVMFDVVPLTAGARVNTMAPTQELVDAYPMIDGTPIEAEGSGFDEEHPFQDRDPRLDATIVHHLSEWVDTDGSTRLIYIEPGTAPDEEAARDEYRGQNSNATPTGYYFRKYYDPTVPGSFESGLNLIVIRYADVLLMHAEAMMELGRLDQSIWNQTIRPIRERAGLVGEALDYEATWTQEDLRALIRRERRIELAFEGRRIFDLRRWETAEDVLNGPVHGAPYGEPTDEVGLILNQRNFDPGTHYLWPIPLSERDLNPNLPQNPGY